MFSFRNRTSPGEELLSMKGKKPFSFFYTLFLCCYLFYAFSPVVYAVAGPTEGHGTSKQATPLKHFRLALVDHILSCISDQETNGDDQSEEKRIPFLKKRALPSSAKKLVDQSIHETVIIRNTAFLLPVTDTVNRLIVYTCREEDGYRFFYSGIAPPVRPFSGRGVYAPRYGAPCPLYCLQPIEVGISSEAPRPFIPSLKTASPFLRAPQCFPWFSCCAASSVRKPVYSKTITLARGSMQSSLNVASVWSACSVGGSPELTNPATHR
jgi:hypothetical protein